MNILLVYNARLPVQTYDDAARVVWWLGKTLAQMGHNVHILAKKGTVCPFATVLTLDDKKPVEDQIPEHIELVHFHYKPAQPISKPYLITCHENCFAECVFDRNTVFVSAQHALRHGGSVYVHNGIDFAEYGTPILEARRMYYHFLGNAEWRGKNVRGAIDLAARLGARLHVIGGSRVNFRKELRITLTPNVRFHGVLNPEGRNVLLNSSKGLLFPAIWHEPFGLALIESLYFGCPVFGTPYGSLPEIITPEVGYLTTTASGLADAVESVNDFNRKHCHEYVMDNFTHIQMSASYVRLYEKVLNGEKLNPKAPIIQSIQSDKFLPFN